MEEDDDRRLFIEVLQSNNFLVSDPTTRFHSLFRYQAAANDMSDQVIITLKAKRHPRSVAHETDLFDDSSEWAVELYTAPPKLRNSEQNLDDAAWNIFTIITSAQGMEDRSGGGEMALAARLSLHSEDKRSTHDSGYSSGDSPELKHDGSQCPINHVQGIPLSYNCLDSTATSTGGPFQIKETMTMVNERPHKLGSAFAYDRKRLRPSVTGFRVGSIVKRKRIEQAQNAEQDQQADFNEAVETHPESEHRPFEQSGFMLFAELSTGISSSDEYGKVVGFHAITWPNTAQHEAMIFSLEPEADLGINRWEHGSFLWATDEVVVHPVETTTLEYVAMDREMLDRTVSDAGRP